MPAAIRKRLEDVERRIRAQKVPSISIQYTTKRPAARADSPQPLPGIPPGGDSAGGEQKNGA
jgi:hypothetical protein